METFTPVVCPVSTHVVTPHIYTIFATKRFVILNMLFKRFDATPLHVDLPVDHVPFKQQAEVGRDHVLSQELQCQQSPDPYVKLWKFSAVVRPSQTKPCDGSPQILILVEQTKPNATAEHCVQCVDCRKLTIDMRNGRFSERIRETFDVIKRSFKCCFLFVGQHPEENWE